MLAGDELQTWVLTFCGVTARRASIRRIVRQVRVAAT